MKLKLVKERPEPEPFNLLVELYWAPGGDVGVFIGDDCVMTIALDYDKEKVILELTYQENLPKYMEYGWE